MPAPKKGINVLDLLAPWGRDVDEPAAEVLL